MISHCHKSQSQIAVSRAQNIDFQRRVVTHVRDGEKGLTVADYMDRLFPAN